MDDVRPNDQLDTLMNTIQSPAAAGQSPATAESGAPLQPTPVPSAPTYVPSSLPTEKPTPEAMTTSSANASSIPPEPVMAAAAPTQLGMSSMKKLLILGGLVAVLAIAGGAWWYWQQMKSSSMEKIPASQTVSTKKTTPLAEDLPTADLEETASIADIPETQDAVVTKLPDQDKAIVNGRICPVESKQLPGKIALYDVMSKVLASAIVIEGDGAYSVEVPAGEYVVIFEPNSEGFDKPVPKLAYTQYVRCGMGVECKNHNLLLSTFEGGKRYAEVNLCDPRYVSDIIPKALQQNVDIGSEP